MSAPGHERRFARGALSRVLVVDDEADIRELIDLTLSRMGLAADCAGSVGEAQALLKDNRYQLCLTDMRLPDGDGLQIVRQLSESGSDTPVAVITAYGSAENAVAALKAGAFDYLAKPVSLEQLRTLVKSALRLPGEAPAEDGPMLMGTSPAMAQVSVLIEKLARSQAPIYISGESGSGKELAARQVHERSARAAAPFVPVNCGAIPENLMESEFFGYRKGAFTGADSEREGFFHAAQGGTLFLDEVADLPLPMQVKLLRAIQEKKVRKVGSTVEEPVDVRIICATHKNLRDCVEQGLFRQDLYYRLNVIELRIPPLRERREDIPELVRAMLTRLCGTQVPELTPAAWQALDAYPFPGNVRELENVLERATALCSDTSIDVADLQLGDECAAEARAGRAGETLDDFLNRVERQAIQEALEKTAGNRTAAARVLGISFRSLRYRLDRLGMEV
ncbi:sigma-54 dependent transcriptional regulator [Azovibrio restrictus]|uniref:sigma-54-dependent transcriptional regulator n=1 Tax=Azovibrio restrictus TaxID=146938 RepID=UPI0026F26D88|nr:sigma-54 dependent transcriptional regulator [Azovibrio restrictus]MDD3482185.1 sigma-54 dependent transcriptional regulator [Azovibrio restrictus]